MQETRSGFTIVELLIVIVVISILATIAIIAYSGIQTRANNTIVVTNLRSTETSLENFRVLNDYYPNSGSDYSSVKNGGLSLKGTLSNTLLYCVDTANPTAWLILAFAYPSGTTYRWTSAGERNSNSGVVIGSGVATCQAQMGGIATVTGSWAVGIATIR
jgi:prepilin-type N-terminal cleavage/methylation domain-containing protein